MLATHRITGISGGDRRARRSESVVGFSTVSAHVALGHAWLLKEELNQTSDRERRDRPQESGRNSAVLQAVLARQSFPTLVPLVSPSHQ